MEKVWIVRVRDWEGDGYVVFSCHRTEAGAEKNVSVANEKYASSSAYVSDYEVKD